MSANGPKTDMTGMRFGSLAVLSYISGTKLVRSKWVCQCDCGARRTKSTNELRSGKSRSCGCAKSAAIGAKKLAHGHTVGRANTRTYRIWTNMKTRCGNIMSSNFKHYGGRGISYAPEWASFARFLSDMGPCPDGLTLERKDNDANYSKDNCMWTTQRRQMRNTCKTVWLEIDGERICLPDAAERYGIKPGTLWSRLKRGSTHADAVKRTGGA